MSPRSDAARRARRRKRWSGIGRRRGRSGRRGSAGGSAPSARRRSRNDAGISLDLLRRHPDAARRDDVVEARRLERSTPRRLTRSPRRGEDGGDDGAAPGEDRAPAAAERSGSERDEETRTPTVAPVPRPPRRVEGQTRAGDVADDAERRAARPGAGGRVRTRPAGREQAGAESRRRSPLFGPTRSRQRPSSTRMGKALGSVRRERPAEPDDLEREPRSTGRTAPAAAAAATRPTRRPTAGRPSGSNASGRRSNGAITALTPFVSTA